MTPTRRRCAWNAPATFALLGASACQGGSTFPAPEIKEVPSIPTTDVGALCADIGPIRACWETPGQSLPSGAHLVDRTVPRAPAASPMGWRCAGQGRTRICADRVRTAPPFVCAAGTCTQRDPRMPDDGEWTCGEMAGAMICAGGERAAGVAPAAADPAWLCGTRQGGPSGDGAGPRVCVDFAADFPDGNLGAWHCRQVNQPAPGRVCEPRNKETLALLTDPCDRARPCVDGGVCVVGRCLPQRPSPSCWLDADCPGGACRFGSCAGQRAQ